VLRVAHISRVGVASRTLFPFCRFFFGDFHVCVYPAFVYPFLLSIDFTRIHNFAISLFSLGEKIFQQLSMPFRDENLNGREER